MPEKTSENITDHKSSSHTYTKLLSILSIILAVIAIAFCVFLWQESKQITLVASQLDDVKSQAQTRIQSLEDELTQQQKNIETTQLSLSTLEKASNNVQREQTLNQIHYLVQLANIQLKVDTHPDNALKLLQLSSKLLRSLNDSDLSVLNDSINKDIQTLNALQKINTTDLIGKIDVLISQINQLSVTPKKISLDMKPITATNDETNNSWRDKLIQALVGLKDLVIIRKNEAPSQPLVSPSQEFFLKQNIQLKLEQAEWAVLHANPDLYKAALSQVQSWINAYFPDKNATQGINDAINQLMNIDIKPKTVSVDNTISVLQELSQSNKSSSNLKADVTSVKDQGDN